MASGAHPDRRRWWRRLVATAGAIALGGGMLAASGGVAGASGSAVAQAERDLLTLANLPVGWTSSSSLGNSAAPHAVKLAKCLGVPVALIRANYPEANSPEFTDPNMSATVDDTVQIFPSIKVAQASLAAYSSTKAPKCLAADLRSEKQRLSTESGGQVNSITVTASPVSFGPGTSASNARISVTINGDGATIDVLSVVGVVGVKGQQVTFTSYGDPLTVPAEQAIVKEAMALI